MYFQLLSGVHLEHRKKYEVTFDRKKTGEVEILKQPVIESEKDLVESFGSDKFRRVYKQEMDNLLLNAGGKAESTSSVPPAVTASESEADKSAKQGAVGIAEPPGMDVTDKFPEVQEIDEEMSLRIYFKRPKGYYIIDDGNMVTDVPLKKDEILNWVIAYKGK